MGQTSAMSDVAPYLQAAMLDKIFQVIVHKVRQHDAELGNVLIDPPLVGHLYIYNTELARGLQCMWHQLLRTPACAKEWCVGGAAKQDKRLADAVDSTAALAKKHALLEETIAQNHTDHQKSIDNLKKARPLRPAAPYPSSLPPTPFASFHAQHSLASDLHHTDQTALVPSFRAHLVLTRAARHVPDSTRTLQATQAVPDELRKRDEQHAAEAKHVLEQLGAQRERIDAVDKKIPLVAEEVADKVKHYEKKAPPPANTHTDTHRARTHTRTRSLARTHAHTPTHSIKNAHRA
jgi:hypothetical protein